MKDDFFDPASLALDDEEGVPELTDTKHRHQDQFVDPVFSPDSFDPSSVAPDKAGLLLDVADAVESIQRGESPVLDLTDLAPETEAPVFTPSFTTTPTSSGVEWFWAVELTRLILSPITYVDLCQRALEILMQGLEAEVGSLFELNQKTNEFFFRATIGSDSAKLASVQVPRGHGLLGEVEQRRLGTLVSRGEDSSAIAPVIAHLSGLQIRDCIAIPIFVGGTFFGVVEVFNKRSEQGFTPADLAKAEAACEIFAKALEVRFLMAKAVKRVG